MAVGAKSIGGGVNKLFAGTANAIGIETKSQHSESNTLEIDRTLTPLQTNETKESKRVKEKNSSSADGFIDLDNPED